VALWLVALATRAHAICSTTICTAYVPPIANACEIKQSYTIDDECQLNFGTKAVTIQGTSTLQSAVGNDYTIMAGSLTVRGKVLARGGSLVLFATGNIDTLGTQGKLDVSQQGSLVVWALGTINLQGSDVTADGTTAGAGGTIVLLSNGMTVASPVHANGNGGKGGSITLTTGAGNIAVSGPVSADASTSATPKRGGTITLDAKGTVTTSNNLTVNGTNDGDGGTIRVTATGTASLGGSYKANGVGNNAFASGGRIGVKAASITISGGWFATGNQEAEGGRIEVETTTGSLTVGPTASISVNGGSSGGGEGGIVRLTGATTASVQGGITANAGGADSSGGTIRVSAPSSVSVSSTLEARSSASNGFSNGEIFIGPSCDVTVTGSLKTRNPAGSGTNEIRYFRSLFLTGAQLLADDDADDGANVILCGCPDANGDHACDSETCRQMPSVSGSTINPLEQIETTLPGVCP
jgi:hypothetical protein